MIHDTTDDIFGPKERPEEELKLDRLCQYNIGNGK